MMMATRPAQPNPPAATTSRRSTRNFRSRPTATAPSSSRYSRRPASLSRPSADLAGRAVALSLDVPAVFDAPLAPHHKLIGRWAAEREKTTRRYTREAARRRIERAFAAEVEAILKSFELADMRVEVLGGQDKLPPALVIICDSVGQLDLGWIEKDNVLSNTLVAPVAPVGWRAAAYQALEQCLHGALPVFGYADLIEELSAYYWDGETEDEGARAAWMAYHDGEAEEDYELTLPSDVHGRRPDWMTAKAAPLKDMPRHLRAAVTRLRDAHKAVKAIDAAGNAWHLDRDTLPDFLPEYMDRAPIHPVTLVPFDHFARELDDVGRFGMEQGFDDVAGLCPLEDVATIDAWFTSLRLGAELLLAAQDLIALDPANRVES